MLPPLTHATAAELVKLRTLPAVAATVLGMLVAAIVLAAGIAASDDGAASAVNVIRATVPFLQIGVILLGVLSAATEYSSGQIRSTLTAMPHRPTVLAGKLLAFLTTATITAGIAVGAEWVTAAIVLSQPISATDLAPVVGATVYLVLIGTLAQALAVLLRSLIPPLVTMLSLVLIVSPLAHGLTEHARWLPDNAGSLLYLTDADAVLDPGTGTLILCGWIAAISILAGTQFLRRDA